MSLPSLPSPLPSPQELQAEVNAHRQQLQRMQERGKALRRSHAWAGKELQERCDQLAEEWEELEESCDRRAVHLNKARAREQVSDAEGITTISYRTSLIRNMSCVHIKKMNIHIHCIFILFFLSSFT